MDSFGSGEGRKAYFYEHYNGCKIWGSDSCDDENIFWVVTSCSLVQNYRRFGGMCGSLKIQAARSSEKSVNIYQTTRRHFSEESYPHDNESSVSAKAEIFLTSRVTISVSRKTLRHSVSLIFHHHHYHHIITLIGFRHCWDFVPSFLRSSKTCLPLGLHFIICPFF